MRRRADLQREWIDLFNLDFGFPFDRNPECKLSNFLRAQVFGEEISDERTIAKGHVVAHMIAAFE